MLHGPVNSHPTGVQSRHDWKVCRGFAGNFMKFVSRHIQSFQRALIALLFAVVTGCVFPWIGAGFHSIALFRSAITAAQSRVPILHVEVDLQPVDVQVKDANGSDVLGLSAKDFTILENGKRQKIAFFDAGNSPVNIAIIVDWSSSMNSNGRIGSPQAIAAQFMRTARPGDKISVMTFSDEMGPFRQLTSEQLRNPSAVRLAPPPSEGSAVYDAIATALCHLRTSKNLRQAVIVITDGVDEYSRITLEQLIGLVRSSRAQLFMIGLQSRPNLGFKGHAEPRLTLVSGQDIDNPVVVFDRLMKESGAESFIPNSQSQLDDALKAVSTMLQSEYTFAYYPQKTSGKLRKIEVKVDRHGAHVLARRFVASAQDASQFVHFDVATCTVSPKFHPYPYEADVTRGPNGMVYRENFSDSHSGWPIHEDSHYVSGGYELSNSEVQVGSINEAMRSSAMDASALPNASPTAASTSTTFRQNVVAANGPWWINFRASVNVNAAPGSVAGLVFRMNQLGYYALFVSRAGKKLSAGLVKASVKGNGYAQMTIVPWTTVAGAPASATEISVEAIGDQISMFVGGQKVKSLHDDAYAQGFVGFVISGHGHATFRNLVVQQQ